MGEIVDVNHQELADAISTMKRSYRRFQAFVDNSFSTELGHLNSMNSDYVEELIKVLTAAKSWQLKSLQKNIGKYVEDADRIYKKIRETDEKLSKQVQLEKKYE